MFDRRDSRFTYPAQPLASRESDALEKAELKRLRFTTRCHVHFWLTPQENELRTELLSEHRTIIAPNFEAAAFFRSIEGKRAWRSSRRRC